MEAAPSQVVYSLQCSVMDEQLRTLSHMLTCLDRFGKELFFEVTEESLSLHTLNGAQSAFVIFRLDARFFNEYHTDFGGAPTKSTSFKLHLRNVLHIFRSIQYVDKIIIQIASAGPEQYMRVQHECNSGLKKKFDLMFEEVTSMKAVYSRDRCVHHISADPSMLLSCLSNFPAGLAEVTLVAMPEAIVLKNDPEVIPPPPPPLTSAPLTPPPSNPPTL